MVKQGPQITAFCVCREHVLGIPNVLSSRVGCGSQVTAVLLLGHVSCLSHTVLLLSKPAPLRDHESTGVSRIVLLTAPEWDELFNRPL